jgi:hypothetical protein
MGDVPTLELTIVVHSDLVLPHQIAGFRMARIELT